MPHVFTLTHVITGKQPTQTKAHEKEVDKKIEEAKEEASKQSMLVQLKALIMKCRKENCDRIDSNALVFELNQILNAYTKAQAESVAIQKQQ